MREIVLDTETTGLEPEEGHRLVEIGCVELDHGMPTGSTLHFYFNPERDMPQEAFLVHGLSEEFLSGQPQFDQKVNEILDFFGCSPLVIHNASFDMAFINHELLRLGRDPLPSDRAIDTLRMARQSFPGAPVSLDALCRRFQIDLSVREKHGALTDAKLLAEVYLELSGGREPALNLMATQDDAITDTQGARHKWPSRSNPFIKSQEDVDRHHTLLDQLSSPEHGKTLLWHLAGQK